MDPPDDDLLIATAAGDRDAFAALYRRRRPDVYRFALHMTGSRAAAEDIAHDVFLVVIRDAHRYQPGRSGVVAWLLGIARNYARRHSAQRTTEPIDGDEAAQGETTPLDAIARDEEVARLRVALQGLPAVYREVIVLCDLEELSYQDAGRVLGCAIGTIRSRLHRGRAMLTAAMRQPDGDLASGRVPKWVL